MNNWNKSIISIFALVALSSLIFAVPAWPGLHTFQQPDGTSFSGYQRGDELGSWFETENGYITKQSASDGWYNYVQKSTSGSNYPASAPQNIDLRVGHADPESISAMRQTDLSSTVPALGNANREAQAPAELPNQFQSAPRASSPSFAPPSTGTHKVIVILVQFNDTVHNPSHTTAYFQNLLFNASNPLSMNSYYREVSYGQLNLTGTVVGWYNSTHSLAYYGADNATGSHDNLNGNISELTREAVLLADSDVNFADYDTDADGVVDHVIIIHAGYGQEYSGVSTDIWSHRWSVQPAQTVDGKNVSSYTMDPEYGAVGTFSHEFGHDLGLPDLYNTITGNPVVGKWDLMDYGSWAGPGDDGSVPTHLSAWSKARLGWINVTNIYNTSRSYNIQNIESNSNAYVANNSVLVGDMQYFLLENRKQVGFDAYIPNQGIVIWHINDVIINFLIASNQVNSASGMEGVIPEYVSTVNDAPYSLTASKQYFNATTTPNSTTSFYNHTTNVSIYVQSPIGTSMTVHFFGGNSSDLAAPVLSPVHIGSNNNNASTATTGNVINLSFTSDKALNQTPIVTISTHSVAVSTVGSNSYYALYTMTSSDTEQTIPFTIDFSSFNYVAGTQVTGTTDGSSVIFDKTPPTCTFDRMVNLSATGYASGSTFYYNSAGGAFQVFVNSSDIGGSLVKNVTFPTIGSGFANAGSLVALSQPYNASYTWTSASATGSKTVACYDNAGNSNTTSFTLTPANTAPSVTISFAEADTFYSPADGNNVIHIRANVTGNNTPIASVSANFTNISTCGGSAIQSLVLNNTNGYYEGICNVTADALTSNFVGGAVVVTTTDRVSNVNVSTGSAVLYNMTTPTSGDQCMQFNASETTNFSTETNFSAINLRLSMMRNGSVGCNGIALPWGNTMKKVMFLNFTSVNLSTQAQAAKLQNLATAINMTISPPKAYENSRIYVNSTYFAELNTTTTIKLYDLPFSSTPNVTADIGAAGVSTTTWAQGTFDASYNTSIGNLTLVVNGFSGYNATDNTIPSATIVSPIVNFNTSGSSVAINVSANGTGTEISSLSINITKCGGGYTDYNFTSYSNITNTANCTQPSPGSEVANCYLSIPFTQDGYYAINVTVLDYGASAGNRYSVQQNFRVHTAAPAIALSSPENSSTTTSRNVSFAWTATDIMGETCNLTIDGVVNRSNLIYASGGSGGGGMCGESALVSPFNTSATSNFSDGVHNWSVSCWDSLNNTNVSETKIFVVDATAPDVTLVSPGISANLSTANVTFNFTAIDALTNMSCNLSIKGIVNKTFSATNGSNAVHATANFTDGNYNWSVSCWDNAGNANSSAVARAFTVDTTAPTITLNAPANGFNTANANVAFNWTATDALRASITCNLTIDGAVNRSNLAVANGTWYNTTADANFTNGLHNWSVSCWDDLGNINNTIAVRNFTVDTTAPTVVPNAPIAGLNTSNSNPTFNWTASDALTNMSCNLSIDGVFNKSIVAINGTPTTTTATSAFADGAHNWSVSCWDNVGNVNNSMVAQAFTVDTTAPTITLNAPANGFNTSNTSVAFNWTATDALRASITCNLTIDGAVNRSSLPVTNGTWYNTTATSNFADGIHNWSVTCWDDLGNTNNTIAVRSFTVDTTAPTVTLNAPASGLNTSNANVVFNWTATDALISSFTCNLTIDGAVNRSSLPVTNGTWYNTTATSNFADGVHNWSVTCWDSLNNTNSPETRFFTVDTIPPAVTLVSPVSAANLSTANVTFNFTAIDALTNMSCNLSINGIVNKTFSATNGSNAVHATANFTDGNYNWSVSCWDNAGNANSSAVARAFTVDTTAPVITIVSPANNTMYNTSSISVNISVTEVHPDTTWFFNGSANETYTSPVSVIYADGDYNLTVWSNDTAGHLSTAVANFTVDTTFPTISFVAPTFNSSSALMVNYMPINVSASDTHLANLTIRLYNSSRVLINSSNATSSNLFANFSGLPDGTYYFNATAYDTAGHANSTATWNVTLDTTAPVISINSPIAYLNTSAASLSFNWTAMDAMRQNITCTLMIDGTANNTTSVQNGTPYSSALIVLNESIHNWQVNCSDDIGNWNVSVLRNFTVDRTAPALTLALPDGSNLSSNVFTLNFSALDALSGINSSACMYSINNGANVSVSNCANTTVNTSVTNGQVNFTLYSSDMTGNTNSSSTSFYVDMVAPTITISVPIANSVLSNNSTTLNFTAVDTNTGLNSSTCYYKLNGVRTNITNCANMTLPEMSNGAQTLIVYAKDNIGNEGSNGVSFVVDVLGTNTILPLNNSTSVSNNASVVVTPYSPAANLTLGSNATNASLNMSDISSTNGSIMSVNLTNPINVTANTSLGNVVVQIPGSLIINGSSGWNGVLYLPSVQVTADASPTDSGTNAVNGVVQLGFSGEQLNFSNAVRILIPGMGGKSAGYVRGTTFTKITATCTTDSQAWADTNLGAAGDCVTTANSGADMVIWTKHFTQFVAYTNTPPSSGGNTGSGSSGGSGGGSVGSGGGAGASIKQSATFNVDIGLGKTCAVTITREMASATNLSTLTTTLENTGGSECSLTDFVFADTIPADFPALNQVNFTPQYTSREGWTVNFNFPTFAAGESKTLSYSANQWIKTSLAKNFTVYTMTAKKQQAAAQPTTNTTTPTVEEPSVWIPTKLPSQPTAPVANTTPPTVQPAPKDNTLTSLVLTGLIVIVVLGGIGGLALYLKGKKKSM